MRNNLSRIIILSTFRAYRISALFFGGGGEKGPVAVSFPSGALFHSAPAPKSICIPCRYLRRVSESDYPSEEELTLFSLIRPTTPCSPPPAVINAPSRHYIKLMTPIKFTDRVSRVKRNNTGESCTIWLNYLSSRRERSGFYM